MSAPARPTRIGRRRQSRPMLRHALLTATTFTVLLALVAGGIAYFEYQRLSGQIHHVSALSTNDPHVRKEKQQLSAENFLVIGSDSRAGDNSSTHDIEGARSDTTILIHLSQNHQHVTVVSIPRDTWMKIPACVTTNNDFAKQGTVYAAHYDQFNSAFSIGGAKCTVAALQELTGILVTHFLQIDFAGFQQVVNALGGVQICSPEAVHDTYTNLHLNKGENDLNGLQALRYVRMRHVESDTGAQVGDGSDLERIKRQQQFLGVVLRQALSGSLLSNPFKLDSFLDALTKSITTDPGTTIGDLHTLATSMSGLNPKHVTFYTAPIANPDYSPPGTDLTGKVLLDQAKGRILYDSIIDDTAGLPSASKSAAPSSSTASSPSGSASSAQASSSASSSSSAVQPDSNAADRTCALYS